MAIDWERRRVNLRILMAAKGLKPTPLARAVDLSPNVITQFTNGTSKTLSDQTLAKILPLLGLETAAELDVNNPLAENPRIAIRKHLETIPEDRLPDLLRELKDRFPIESN